MLYWGILIGLAVIGVAVALLVSWLRAACQNVQHVDPKTLRNLKNVPQDTLFALLQPHIVPMETIRARGYGSLLEIVHILIGVVPTCDMLLEIWPPAFHTYNVIVPNFLNLPALLLGVGTRPSSLITLSMYVSSRAAECPYCTAHTCSFAARRGLAPAKLKAVLGGRLDGKELTSAERASVAVARSLGCMPCELTREEVRALKATVAEGDVEWIVAAATMFGSFNKLMDGLGVPLEPDTVAETMDLMGSNWSAGKASQMLPLDMALTAPPKVDDWRVILKTLWLGLKPGGLAATDARLVRGMPTTVLDASTFLRNNVGHSFPVLAHLTHSRLICAIATVISLNFDDTQSAGLTGARKVLAAAVAADTMQDRRLLAEMVVVGAKFGVVQKQFDEAVKAQHCADPLTTIMLQAAKALAYSPVKVTAELVSDLRQSDMTPPMLVELVSLVACVQMLHRLESFFLFESDE